MCRGNSRVNESCYLWQRSNSEKVVFDLYETYVCHRVLFNYKMYLFTNFDFGTPYPKKSNFFLCQKIMCSFNRTVQQRGAKNILKSTISGYQFFFRFNWLKIKTKFEIILVRILSAGKIFDITDEDRGVISYVIYMHPLSRTML